jgi:pyruvate dehydrogenase (quinone)
MASAPPNAVGAQLVFPGRQTIARCGDGGFTMLAVGDPSTEVQRKTPVVHVIFDDGLLDFVNIEQEAAGLIPFGTDFVYPDLAKVAEAGRAKGIRLEDPQDVRDGLRAALVHREGR